jgi:hypothetical protein
MVCLFIVVSVVVWLGRGCFLLVLLARAGWGGGGIWARRSGVFLIARKRSVHCYPPMCTQVSVSILLFFLWRTWSEYSPLPPLGRPMFVLPPRFCNRILVSSWADTHSALSNDLLMGIPCSFGVFVDVPPCPN